jgi:hypothetical protein
MNWFAELERMVDQDVRRLDEIVQELGTIGAFLQGLGEIAAVDAARPEQTEALARKIDLMTVPGFCAYTLSEQALALIKTLSARIAFLAAGKENTVALADKLHRLQRLVSELEPHLDKTLDEMRPWRDLDGRAIAEAIVRRAGSKPEPASP